MIFARTVHQTSAGGKGAVRVETRQQAWELKPGASFETQDGAVYDVERSGAVRRRGKVKAPKRLRRKARAIAREALGQ